MRWQLIKYFRKNQSSVSGVFSSKESTWSFLSTSLYFILFYFCLKSLLFSEKISFSLTIVFMTFDDKHFFYDAYITYYI